MNYLNIFKSIINDTKKLIYSEKFATEYSIGSSFTRKRKLSFINVMCFMLHASKKSLTINLADFKANFPNLNLPSVSKQAMSKARQGIHSDALYALLQTSVKGFYTRKSVLNKWHGFNIWAIDGTTIQVPHTEENRLEFGTNPNQHSDEGALASVSALYDVIIDAHIKQYRYPERT